MLSQSSPTNGDNQNAFGDRQIFKCLKYVPQKRQY